MTVLAKILDDKGYLADFKKLAGNTYRMSLHNCAIWGVASRCGQACTTELEFLREVLPETEIERITHKMAGAYVCGYEIRPRAAKPRVPSKSPASQNVGLTGRRVLRRRDRHPPPSSELAVNFMSRSEMENVERGSSPTPPPISLPL